MTSLFIRLLAAWALMPTLAFAQAGLLEVPAQDSHQSGIGLISGWHCSAQRIEVSIDLGPPILVGSHTPRQDTASVCGRADTGFGMTFNWNILKETRCCDLGDVFSHRVTVFADGVKFADTTFNTANFGSQFLTGRSATYSLPNFPNPAGIAKITWDQDTQNFSIIDAGRYYDPPTPELGGSGVYYGAIVTSATNTCTSPFTQGTEQDRYGKFIVRTENGQMQLRAEYADGGVCELPAVSVSAVRPLVNGSVKAHFDGARLSACPELGSFGMDVSVNGTTLDAVIISCLSVRITAATVAPVSGR